MLKKNGENAFHKILGFLSFLTKPLNLFCGFDNLAAEIGLVDENTYRILTIITRALIPQSDVC